MDFKVMETKLMEKLQRLYTEYHEIEDRKRKIKDRIDALEWLSNEIQDPKVLKAAITAYEVGEESEDPAGKYRL